MLTRIVVNVLKTFVAVYFPGSSVSTPGTKGTATSRDTASGD